MEANWPDIFSATQLTTLLLSDTWTSIVKVLLEIRQTTMSSESDDSSDNETKLTNSKSSGNVDGSSDSDTSDEESKKDAQRRLAQVQKTHPAHLCKNTFLLVDGGQL